MGGDFLIRMLFGHFFADYLFQSMWMAFNKKRIFDAVLVHCLIYTFCVIMFLYPELSKLGVVNNIIISVLIFLSHWILDGTDLLDKFLGKVNARTYKKTEEYINSLDDTSTVFELQVDYARSYNAIVHTVADNTIHLFLMYLIFKFFI